MDASLRSSHPHLARWFTTVLGQKEVKEVLAGLNLEESVPKAATTAPTAVAFKTKGKGLIVSTLKGNWPQNSQTSFVCFEFLDTFPQSSSWHQNSQICFVCLEFVICSYQPLPAFTNHVPCFCLDSSLHMLSFVGSCALLVCDLLFNLLQFQRQALLPVPKPWKKLSQKAWLLYRYF